jgi:aryl-alcohol dehydrogenase (NADP+)
MYYTDSDFDVVDRVVELAKRRGVTPAQIALAWILHKPGVTAPIIGASKMEQFEQSLAALDIALDGSEMQFLEEPYKPHAVLGHK